MTLRAIGLLFAAGLLAGALTHGALSVVFARATLAVFIPALIFEAAWHLRTSELRSHWRSVALLIVPGVPITAAIVGAAAFLVGTPLPAALALGAILSATDPIAVVAIFRRLNIPESLMTIVEGESLFNDAVAVVLYRAVVVAAATSVSAAPATLLIAGAFAGSALSLVAGAALGTAAGWASSRIQSRWMQLALSIAGAYGAYIVCDELKGSGIFAVIAFGVVMRRTIRGNVALAATLDRSWHRIGTVANGALFFLMGAALDPLRLSLVPVLIVVTLLAVLAARSVLAYALLAFVHMPVTWKNLVRVAGMRGALSLALALALPPEFPQRGAVELATFAVVIATVLLGTFTLERRLRRVEF